MQNNVNTISIFLCQIQNNVIIIKFSILNQYTVQNNDYHLILHQNKI